MHRGSPKRGGLAPPWHRLKGAPCCRPTRSLLKTTDAGLHWSQVTTPLSGGSSAPNLRTICSPDGGTHMWAMGSYNWTSGVGGDNATLGIYTIDAGSNWQLLNMVGEAGGLWSHARLPTGQLACLAHRRLPRACKSLYPRCRCCVHRLCTLATRSPKTSTDLKFDHSAAWGGPPTSPSLSANMSWPIPRMRASTRRMMVGRPALAGLCRLAERRAGQAACRGCNRLSACLLLHVFSPHPCPSRSATPGQASPTPTRPSMAPAQRCSPEPFST